MSARKYKISHLTDTQLADIEKKYPTSGAVITIRKPVYKVIAMLLDCNLEVPHMGEKPAFLKNTQEKTKLEEK